MINSNSNYNYAEEYIEDAQGQQEGSKLVAMFTKFKQTMGLEPKRGDDEYDEEEFYEELYGAIDEEQEEMILQDNPIRNRKNNLKVVSHPNASTGYEMMVIEPRSFEESLEVVNNLRSRKSLILNLHLLDADQSQRVVDFVSGATHAIDGHQQKVGEGVFVFTPSNINISVETEKTRIIRDAFWNQA
jgi:cell division inhibitor SepF